MRRLSGAIAQLGERLHGMQEVGGSIPPSSTKFLTEQSPTSPSSRGLGHRPFTAVTGVRIPLGTPYRTRRPAESGSSGLRGLDMAWKSARCTDVLCGLAGFSYHLQRPVCPIVAAHNWVVRRASGKPIPGFMLCLRLMDEDSALSSLDFIACRFICDHRQDKNLVLSMTANKWEAI